MATEMVTDLTRGIYRRLYAGFIKGRRINTLSLSAEAWFWRVLASADDFGNADAEPGLCYAATVGRRKGISIKEVEKWLGELGESGLIQFYTSESGDKYLHIVGFEELQPAGKNGKRVCRFPRPGESGLIQNNPDFLNSSLASHSHSDPHSDSHSHSDSDKADAPPFLGEPFLVALSEFEQHRKEKRAKLTPTASRALYKKLENMGEESATAALIYSTAQGWTGIFPERMNNGTNQQHRETASERRARNFSNRLAIVAELRGEGSRDYNEGDNGERVPA